MVGRVTFLHWVERDVSPPDAPLFKDVVFDSAPDFWVKTLSNFAVWREYVEELRIDQSKHVSVQ